MSNPRAVQHKLVSAHLILARGNAVILDYSEMYTALDIHVCNLSLFIYCHVLNPKHVQGIQLPG